LCSIHATDAERIALSVPFLRIGIERGEKCVYVGDPAGADGLARALDADGVDTGHLLAKGALAFRVAQEVYLDAGAFAPERMLAFWQRESIRAKSDGYGGLRAAVEIDCASQPAAVVERWLEYEARLTELLAGCDCLLLCQYDGPRCPPRLLLDVLQSHPLVFHDGMVCGNPCFAAAPQLLPPAEDQRTVQRWLNHMGERERHDRELDATARLHELTVRMISGVGVRSTLNEVLDAVIKLQRAELGLIQLYNRETRMLDILAQRGFSAGVLEGYPNFSLGDTKPGRMRVPKFLVLEDLGHDPVFQALRELGAKAGFRALQATPLLGRRGRLVGVISTCFRDGAAPSEQDLRLTGLYASQAAHLIEQKRSDEALRRGQAYLDAGQRISHTGSWAWNARSGELFWSAEHYRILGLNRHDSQPTYASFFESVHADDRSGVREGFEAAVRERRGFSSEYRAVRPDGGIRHIRSEALPMVDDAGALLEYIGTVVDVTERKDSEEVIRKARAELAHVNRALTVVELTASIAHELNQPLAAVVANASACERWLAARPANEDEAHSALRRITRDANRAAEVIARVRALLTGRQPDKSALRLGESIAEVLALVGGDARHKEISLSADVEDDLPPIYADRVRIQQVLLNLLVNAMDALSFASQPRTLAVSARREGAEVRVRVRDSGSGIEPQSLARLFEPFFTTKTHGMGMGLAISRSIIEDHGGRIGALNNADGGGATFEFTLSAYTQVQ
jgi:PAS domain S-box-containing protein